MNVPSPLTLHLLRAFLSRPKDWRHGYELSATTGLRHGTIYPQLLRLEARGVLESFWEQEHSGRGKPRHVYRLTESGRKDAEFMCDLSTDSVGSSQGQRHAASA